VGQRTKKGGLGRPWERKTGLLVSGDAGRNVVRGTRKHCKTNWRKKGETEK